MKYNLELLQKHYIDTGKVIKQNHPTLPLSIYNYSRECQYNGNWDRYTLACRGLVLDTEGNVIAKPFPKFFNYEEIKDDKYAHCEGCRKSGMINCGYFDECGGWEMRSVIPNESFEVYEKMDGSLGIIFHYERELSINERLELFREAYPNNSIDDFAPGGMEVQSMKHQLDTRLDRAGIPNKKGEWHMATRGSFTSEQAIKGKEMLDKLNKTALIPGYTYLVEIIYPENRIVVDYGDEEKLVVLGAYNNETGKEVEVDEMVNEGWEVVMKYKTWGEDWETLKKEISKYNEGYVIRFSGGMRMKIKGDEYVRLHRILTNFSTKDIWELLKNGEPLEPFLDRVPDEFDAWVKEVIKDLQTEFDTIKNKIEIEFRELIDKKEFADKIADNPNRSLLFKRLDSYSPQFDEMIWKLLKPKYEKPFKKDEK
jgi:RNA ligase